MDFAQAVTDLNLRPPTQVPADFLGPQWFWFVITLPNADTTAQNMRLNTVLTSDAAVAAQFQSVQDQTPELLLHIDQMHVHLLGASGIAISEKQKLVRGMYVEFTDDAKPVAFELGPHITEPYRDQVVTFDSDDTAASVQRGCLNGPPLILPRPMTLDLSTNGFQIKFSEATPATPGDALIGVFGAIAGKAKFGLNAKELSYRGNKIGCANGRVSVGMGGEFDRASGMLAARAMGAGRKTTA